MNAAIGLNVGDIVAARTVSKLLDSASEVLADGYKMLPQARAAAREAEELAQLVSYKASDSITSSVTEPLEQLLAGADLVTVRGVETTRDSAFMGVRDAAKQLSRAWNIEFPVAN